MGSAMLPLDHMHTLLDRIVPAQRWDGTSDFAVWQKNAEALLAERVGLAEIESCRTSADVQIEWDRESPDLGCREIRFRFFSEENVSVPCHLLIPSGAKGPLPVVICLQGHSKGMHISLGRVIYPGDEKSISGGDRDFARRAVREGICAITVEQRCFGESGGTPEGPNCREAAMRAILMGRTLIGERVWDIMRTIDVLESDFSDLVDCKKILCLGNSGGGTATTYAMALEKRIRIGVPSCAVCRYADSIGAMLHCECNYVPGLARDFDMGDLLAMAYPRRWIVVSGAEDPIFPLAGAKACVEEARRCYGAMGIAERVQHIIGNGGHRFYADDSWPLIHKAISEL